MHLNILSILLPAFLGYIIGRLGDYYFVFWMKDPEWAPHHWIYGLILTIIGFFLLNNIWGMWIFFFGIGLFVSDLKDFLDFKFIGADKKKKSQRRFWHID